jgi:hypothetical protein
MNGINFEKTEMNKIEKENYKIWLSSFPPEKNRTTMEPFLARLSGVTFSNEDPGIPRQRIIRASHPGDMLLLVAGPENKYDKFAVKVLRLDGHQIGYLPSANCAEGIHRNLLNGHRVDCRIHEIRGDETKWVTVELTKWTK